MLKIHIQVKNQDLHELGLQGRDQVLWILINHLFMEIYQPSVKFSFNGIITNIQNKYQNNYGYTDLTYWKAR